MSFFDTAWDFLVANPPSYVISTYWILVVTITLILSVAFTTLWERKVIGWMQLRKGPNRVGSIFGFVPGIFQPFADVIKLLIKEVVIPSASNRLRLASGSSGSEARHSSRNASSSSSGSRSGSGK